MTSFSLTTGLFRCGGRKVSVAVLIGALSVSACPVAATPIVHPPKASSAGAHKKKSSKAVVSKPVGARAAAEVAPSEGVSRVLAWIAADHDNGSLPYLVIDKQAAELFLFGADGRAIGQTPVLIGIGVGDDSTPGIGAKTLAQIGPAERTTPAGRFVAHFGWAVHHTRVLWVDYANSVALHAVITTNKREHRVARLLSPTPDDNRISFGCINVGSDFYARQVRPLFQKAGGMVYILPDTKPLDDVFPRLRLLPYLGDGRSGDAAGQASPEPPVAQP